MPLFTKELLFFLFLSALPATAFSKVKINEVAWMGTKTSTYHEWIELKNEGEEKVDLAGWTLAAGDRTPEINLAGKIAPRGFFLLERTDEETCPEVTADQIYKGNLKNEGELLLLKNEKGEVVDKVEAEEGWPAGDNLTKQTMERKEERWQTSLAPGGTPKKENSEIKTSSLQKRARILSKEAYRRPARRRFLKTFFLGAAVSLVSASLILVIKRILKKEKLLV